MDAASPAEAPTPVINERHNTAAIAFVRTRRLSVQTALFSRRSVGHRPRTEQRLAREFRASHEAAVTAVMGHANIETTRRIYAGDWREAEERNALVLRQLAEAGIGQ